MRTEIASPAKIAEVAPRRLCWRICILVLLTGCGRISYDKPDTVVSTCDWPEPSCAGTVFCADFAGELRDTWGWICDGDGYQCSPTVPEVAVETAQSTCHDGGLRVYTQGGAGALQNAYAGIEFAVPESYFLRFALYVPSTSQVNGTGLVLMIGEDSTGNRNHGRFGVGAEEGQLRLYLNGTNYSFPGTLKRDDWSCVELALTPSTADVWLEDQLIYSFEGATLREDYSTTGFGLGIVNSSDAGETEIFFDDFAVSDARMGCRGEI